MQRNCVFFRGAVKWPQSASPSHEIPSCCWPEVYQRGDRQTNCWAKGVILVNPRAMEIFLKIKPNLKPKLLQFTDLLTSMDIVWKKLRRGYDPWERARWNLSFPKPSVQGQPPCRNPGRGLELLSILRLLSKAEIQSSILLSLLKGSPCCAQQEFHCWPQKMGHAFASKFVCSFCIRIVLQLTVSWHRICVPFYLWGRSSPGPQRI